MESVKDNIKVSVVVPVYNTEKYLKECLESILNQTLEELELICVDDGSDDNSVSIIREYMKKDSRVSLIEQQHQFAGEARNKGLAAAHGRYVIFLDSDDFFEPSMLEDLYEKAENNAADIVLFGGNRYDDATGISTVEKSWLKTAGIEETEVFSRRDYPLGFLLITSPAPWTKFFNRAFILNHHIRFQNLHNTNDLYFTMLAMSCADRVTYIDHPYVNYRVNLKNNIQSNKKEHPFDFLIALKSLLSELKARNLYEDVSFCFVRLARSVTLFSLRTADQETESIIIRKLVNEKFYHEILINSEPLDDRNIELIERRTRKEQFISRISGSLPIDETVICGKVNQPLCSVIIPVYNTEKYLDKCLSSIRKQTENNLEIICVNDGSEDGSLDILKKHAATDPRITVVSQQNSGLSCARNTGIKHATGQYIYFMDSDDVLREDAIKILTQLMLDKNLDTVFFDADTFYDEQVTDEEKKSIYNPSYRRNHEYEGVYSGRTIADEMIRNQEYYVSACLQINRREFLTEHKNYFEPWILYEDNPFTFRNILYAERVSYINEPFFQRRIRKNSIMTTKRTYLNSYSYFICYMRMMKELLNYNATEPVPDTLLQLPDNVLYSSRDIYMKLSEDDQFGDEFLTGLTRGLFRKEIVDYCRNLKEHSELSRTCEEMKEESEIMKSEIEKQKDEIRFNQMLYRDMKNSLSFKIGSATTAVPRKIRDLLKMIIK